MQKFFFSDKVNYLFYNVTDISTSSNKKPF